MARPLGPLAPCALGYFQMMVANLPNFAGDGGSPGHGPRRVDLVVGVRSVQEGLSALWKSGALKITEKLSSGLRIPVTFAPRLAGSRS